MARGSKTAYTEKQKREAEHIAEGYAKRGVSATEAKRRAWATVNAMTGGGKKSGSGRGKAMNLAPAKKGGKVTTSGRITVAADGMSRTVNSTTTDAKGKKASATVVYDKQM